MTITFLQLAQKVLEEEKRPLSASEIWNIVQAKGYEGEVGSKGKTPGATLGALLYVDVRDNPESKFASLGARPKRFALKSLVDKLGIVHLETSASPVKTQSKIGYLEKDLHPFLAYYGFYYLKAYLKTIRHSRSGKRAFGEWVHPDMVGCYFPFSEWRGEVVEVSSLMGNAAIKLFSFEIKREISIGNLREVFFQAVSNSTWANEGYVVAAEVDSDDDFKTELERLSTSFGIGVIQIDIEDPDATETFLPARPREVVDWETVNKLASINPDFRDFLKRIKTDIASREIRQEKYDEVVERDALIRSILKKK